MAVSTATLTLYEHPRGVDNTQRNQVLRGTVALSQGTYPAGGYSLSWATLVNAGSGRVESIPLATTTPSTTSVPAPFDVDFKSIGNPPVGYVYIWNSVTGNLHIFVSANQASAASGPLIEGVGSGTSTLPATLFQDTVEFTAYFTRN